MLKKILWLIFTYTVFEIICFIFHFSFIRTGLISVASNEEGSFIMKVFSLLLVAIFLLKNNLLKKQINFYKIPRAKNIITVLAILAVYIFYEISKTVFFHYNYKLRSSKILPLDTINILLLAPVIEEILYRGLMINYLLPTKQNKRWYIILCFVIISFLFTIMHNDFGLYHFIGHLITSLVLCTFYYYQRNIYLVILFHLLFNLFAIIFNSCLIDLTELPLSREWYLIGLVIFLGLTMYSLFRLSQSNQSQ